MHTVVVGAGSAGAIIAGRMSESAEHEVTLVEAGPDYPTPQDVPFDLRDGTRNSMHAHDWGYRLKPTSQQPFPFDFPRGRVVGGSSAVNTCIALRGHAYDYDEWAALGLDAWSFEACMPAFLRVENDLDFVNEWHSQSGPTPIRRHTESELVPWQAAFLEACDRLGYPRTVDHNNPDLPCGAGPHSMNKVSGERMSAARCYLSPDVRRRKNLSVRPLLHVHRLAFRGARCIGIEVIERGGRSFVIEADRVVLSGGAVGSLGVLLRSGIGPKRELERLGVDTRVDSPTVGAKLLDHPGVAILFTPRAGIAKRSDPLIQVMVRYTSKGSPYPFDMATQPGSFLPLAGVDLPCVSMMTCMGKPRGFGTIHFPSADPFAKPQVESRFLADPTDRASAVEALERMWQLARTAPLRDMAFPLFPTRKDLSSTRAVDAIVELACGSGYHPSGTVPMGASLEQGAVDQYGRVWGVDGVRVADASIMPTIPSANTNLPTLMIGERFGEWLRDGLEP